MAKKISAAESARRGRLIGEQATSGLTHAEFCRREKISLHAFRIWKYRGRPRGVVRQAGESEARSVGRAEPLRLLPVRVVERAGEVAKEVRIEIALRGGRTVRVGPGFDEATLARLVAVLEGATC